MNDEQHRAVIYDIKFLVQRLINNVRNDIEPSDYKSGYLEALRDIERELNKY